MYKFQVKAQEQKVLYKIPFGVRDEQHTHSKACGAMGNAPSGRPAQHEKPHFVAMGEQTRRSNSSTSANESDAKNKHNTADHSHSLKESKCCGGHGCLKVLFVLLAVLIVLISIALIVVSVSTAIATKIYSSDLSGRLVAMIILAVTAAATLSIVIYAAIAVFRKKVKPLHATSIVLVILMIIQAIIAGVSVRVTQEDEFSLSRSLAESFRLARDDNPRHMKIWATTQNDLTCCGVYGPEDYRRAGAPPYFPPDIPISCCPSFDPDRSELVQERAKDICRSRNEFYQVGCKGYILQVFKETAHWVLSVTIVLIIFEFAEVVIGSILTRKTKNDDKEKAAEEGRTGEKSQNGKQ